MTIHDNATALLGRFRAFEASGTNPMPRTAKVLAAETFRDGLNGFAPVHFGADTPNMPLSLASYPVPGLRLATGSIYNPLSSSCSAIKRFTHQRNAGILSISAEYAIQGENAPNQWSGYLLAFDLQNFDGSFRSQPGIQISPATSGTAGLGGAQAGLVDDTQTVHNITDVANPVTGSTVSSTQYLLAGENENKANRNYLRLSFDLGNLLQANGSQNNPATGVPWVNGDITARYYEANINGYRFDLRATQVTHPPGRAKSTPQAGDQIASFNGGCNAQISLFQAPTATGAAILTVTGLVVTYHDASEAWL